MFSYLYDRLISNHQVYDWIQYGFGLKKTYQRLQPLFTVIEDQVVLDIGAGTGLYASLLPASATYLWVDIDFEKLNGFKKRFPTHLATIGDATHICVRDCSVDYALCIALSHHLDDTQLQQLFSELCRVVKHKIIFLDSVKHPNSMLSNLLWKLDRGSYPRYPQSLLASFKDWFTVESIEYYSIYHHYLLCTLIPLGRGLPTEE